MILGGRAMILGGRTMILGLFIFLVKSVTP